MTAFFCMIFAAGLVFETAQLEGPSKSLREKVRGDPTELTDLSGYYICKGKEANGKPYTGIVVLTKAKDIYVAKWALAGGSDFAGVCIRQENTLAASWSMPNKEGQIVRGINMYRVELTSSGPRLVGRWATLPGNGAQQTETLTFLKSLEDEKGE